MEETFLIACQEVAQDILTCLEMGLGLHEGVFTNCMKTRVDELRINYYPPLPVEKLMGGKHKRVWPYTYFGFVTLLFQDAVGGLETENREKPGTWIPVSCESLTEMGVYISDTLAHMTNDHLRSGVHQVVSPISIQDYEAGVLQERYSIALFAKADREAKVGSLERYNPGNPRRYQDLTAFDLHRKRVGQLYGGDAIATKSLD
jgi:isopenicillin N synthase-like dioxygenase